jgi:uncharacterized NAD(P)/FAD-binding protein YdhS
MQLPFESNCCYALSMNKIKVECDVAIIGGGFSGTMVAIHLIRAQRGLRVALIERGKIHGRGVAYGTTDAKHLLNVRADQMGAFPDDIGHFYRWLQAHPQNMAAADVHVLQPDAYIPRIVFGDYIEDLLREARALPGTLDIIHDEIIDLEQVADGRFELAGKNGNKIRAERVVLALGNFPPGKPRQDQPWLMNNPYSAEIHKKLAEPGDVLIIGTGLTSLDMLMTLDKAKQEGTIHLLSRRGLFPQPHKKADPYPTFLEADNLPQTTRALFHQVVKEIRQAQKDGIDWRAVIDSLRPLHQTIWTSLNQIEQRRFLRHVQGLWDTRRHRCAPEIMAVKSRLEEEGRLICHQGRIENFELKEDLVEVTYLRRGTQEVKKFQVRRVLSCTGPQSDYRKLKDVLVQRLLAHDLLAPDPLLMGASTAEGGQVRNQAGEIVPHLYTLGSTQKGRLYESIAVPELRGQAADLAARLMADLMVKRNRKGMSAADYAQDPRVYMAAERTFLAWLRTGLAFMGFGFVVARFGFLLRELISSNNVMPAIHKSSPSLPAGIALIIAGVVINIFAAIRHGHYIKALDEGHFRKAYKTNFAGFIVAFLSVIGVMATFYLTILAK